MIVIYVKKKKPLLNSVMTSYAQWLTLYIFLLYNENGICITQSGPTLLSDVANWETIAWHSICQGNVKSREPSMSIIDDIMAIHLLVHRQFRTTSIIPGHTKSIRCGGIHGYMAVLLQQLRIKKQRINIEGRWRTNKGSIFHPWCWPNTLAFGRINWYKVC